MAEIVWIRLRGVSRSTTSRTTAAIMIAPKTTYGLATSCSAAARATRTPMPAATSTKSARITTSSMAEDLSDVAEGRREGSWGGRGSSARRGDPLARQLRHEPVVKLIQTLDDHLRLGQDRHEVGVAVPA